MGFPGQEYEVGCHFLHQGIFPTQGVKPAFPVIVGKFITTEPLKAYSNQVKA